MSFARAIAADPVAVGLLVLCAAITVFAVVLVVYDALARRRDRRRLERGKLVRLTGRRAREALIRELEGWRDL